ncbi:MAG: tRNA (adenosine(37)-N6)-threonylcarbamoyltransferase complex ATPase subunit type 1 TsaE [Planctomycetaceae bacterium]|nr:tRNA (adenosine(37)-N6)-threonylcarbamoyltransferase complex ATPase subunit type 1 TsaE [Planctomycetaceae bacterium]
MSSVVTFRSGSESDTDRFSSALAAAVSGGLVIALNGQLGAGKTRLVRGFCRSLGVGEDHVSSPTFVLMQLYTDGRIPIAHFDTYRLGDPEEFHAIGADEYLNSSEWLCLVEWADRVEEILPEDHLTIRIAHTGETERLMEVSSGGSVSSDVLSKLRMMLSSQ